MMQKQKGFSAPVLAMSVWTAALAEEMQTGISPRGMIIHGAVQALLLTCISGVFSACWQRAAQQWVWLFSAGAWFLAELFGTVMQAQNICQQEFRSMALIGLRRFCSGQGGVFRLPAGMLRHGCCGGSCCWVGWSV